MSVGGLQRLALASGPAQRLEADGGWNASSSASAPSTGCAAEAQGRRGGRPPKVDDDVLAIAQSRRGRGDHDRPPSQHRSTLYRALHDTGIGGGSSIEHLVARFLHPSARQRTPCIDQLPRSI
jgi:hypothetical protein